MNPTGDLIWGRPFFVGLLHTVTVNAVVAASLPGWIFQTAARRSVSGILQGETKRGDVISGGVSLESKLVWSQVAAGLRSPFRQD